MVNSLFLLFLMTMRVNPGRRSSNIAFKLGTCTAFWLSDTDLVFRVGRKPLLRVAVRIFKSGTGTWVWQWEGNLLELKAKEREFEHCAQAWYYNGVMLLEVKFTLRKRCVEIYYGHFRHPLHSWYYFRENIYIDSKAVRHIGKPSALHAVLYSSLTTLWNAADAWSIWAELSYQLLSGQFQYFGIRQAQGNYEPLASGSAGACSYMVIF